MSIIFISGGARSGKTSYALQKARSDFQDRKLYYIATAQAFDQEMTDRIARHKEEREKIFTRFAVKFTTIEEPHHLASALMSLPANAAAVVDCLTLWLNNLLLQKMQTQDNNAEVSSQLTDYRQVQDFLQVLKRPPLSLVLIGNEVGMGIVSPNRLARIFGDLNGNLNQETAALADTVILMVSGIPVNIKTN